MTEQTYITQPVSLRPRDSRWRMVSAFGLVVGDVLNAQELEDFEQRLAVVTKGHSSVVGVTLLNQHMAVEPAHLGNGEHADAAKATAIDYGIYPDAERAGFVGV